MNKTQQLSKEKLREKAVKIYEDYADVHSETTFTALMKALQVYEDHLSLLLNSLKEEVEQSLTEELDTSKMLEGFEKYWTKQSNGRYIERCIECGNTERIEKVLTLLSETISN